MLSDASPGQRRPGEAVQAKFNATFCLKSASNEWLFRALLLSMRSEKPVMKRYLAVALCVCFAVPAFAQQKEESRLKESYSVMKAVAGMPDGIPRDLLNKSECVVVFPSVKKAAFVVGASYGRGVMTCRSGQNFRGPWSAPAFFALEGGSFGLQIGGQATDFVLLIMNDQGAQSVMTSKVKLGGDASVAAGPVGRTTSAETDVVMKAEILSWSRNRGVFAGVSLTGSTLRSDDDANKNLYGKDLNAKQIILQGDVKTPPAGRQLVSLLNRMSPKHM
jgi:lipid-binding SYLF domain-containing protein